MDPSKNHFSKKEVGQLTEQATKAQKLRDISEIEDEGPLIFPRERKEEPVVQKKPNQPMIPSFFPKKRKTRVGRKSFTPKEPIKIPSSNGSSLSNNEATPTPTPQPSSPPPLQSREPISPITTSSFSVIGLTWRRNWTPWVQQTREENACRKLAIAFLTRNQQNCYSEEDIIHQPHMEPIHRQ
ncbi:hypothetical protein AAZX31_03G080000 [Glycine max]|nr:hypothetical protein GLYMA_03G088250v4 [Glycine max]KAH1069182.1 hypothetical protein GYH30_006676 [Glycine max]